MIYQTTKRLFPLFIALLAFCQFASAADWPKWLGPNGNNVVAAEPSFDPDLNEWKSAWQSDIGLGYSTVTVAQDRAYTMGHDGNSQETILCLDANTGATIWKFSYKGELIPKMHSGGPNASVTISGDHVYALSKDGQAFCLNAKNGDEVWRARLTEIMDMEVPSWGFASSPLEYDNQILLSAGKVTALNKENGKANWTTKPAHKAGYATPVIFKFGSKEYIAAFDSDGFSVLSARNRQRNCSIPFAGPIPFTPTNAFTFATNKER